MVPVAPAIAVPLRELAVLPVPKQLVVQPRAVNEDHHLGRDECDQLLDHTALNSVGCAAAPHSAAAASNTSAPRALNVIRGRIRRTAAACTALAAGVPVAAPWDATACIIQRQSPRRRRRRRRELSGSLPAARRGLPWRTFAAAGTLALRGRGQRIVSSSTQFVNFAKERAHALGLSRRNSSILLGAQSSEDAIVSGREADGVLSLLAEKSRAAALLPPMLSII